MPEEFQQYIAGWRELHPDWEIKRWDENNFPLDNDYVKKAIEGKNWSNVSNYARLYLVRKEGGIYMDIDFKLVKPLDELLENDLFFGFESGTENEFWINDALMGASSGLPLLQKAIEKLTITFDGLEQSNLSGPQFITKFLLEEFPDITYGDYKNSGVRIYPKDFFYPINFNERYKLIDADKYISDNTVAIHTWGRTWFTLEQCLQIIDNLEYNLSLKDALIKSTQSDLEREMDNGKKNEVLNSQVNELKNENMYLAELAIVRDIFLKKLEKKDELVGRLLDQNEDLASTMSNVHKQFKEIFRQQKEHIQKLETALEEERTEKTSLRNDIARFSDELEQIKTERDELDKLANKYRGLLNNSSLTKLIRLKYKGVE